MPSEFPDTPRLSLISRINESISTPMRAAIGAVILWTFVTFVMLRNGSSSLPSSLSVASVDEVSASTLPAVNVDDLWKPKQYVPSATSTPRVDTDDTVHVYRFWKRGLDESTGFLGFEPLHMTSHVCVGVRHYNKTCMFRNLVLDTPTTTQRGGNSAWTYMLAVDSALDDTAVAQRVKQVMDEVGELDLHSMQSIYQDMKGAWSLQVEVYNRKTTEHHVTVMPRQLVPMPNGLESTQIVDALVVDPAGAPFVHDEHQRSHYFGECEFHADVSVPAGVSCLPPFASKVFGVPAGYLLRAVHWNIGHTFSDDFVPILSAIYDLGLWEYVDEFVPLFGSVPPEIELLWGNNRLTKQFYKGISPKHHPILYREVLMDLGLQNIVFRTLVAGLSGRSPHGIRPNYSSAGAEVGLLWKIRDRFLRAEGLDSVDADWRMQSTDPIRIMLIQKPDKRRITTIDAIVQAIREIYGTSVEVTKADWAQFGGITNEIRETLKTHILAGVDGTGMIGSIFLPPGSVYISIPTGGRHGFPEHLGDFMINGLPQIRILYYEGLAEGEYHGVQGDIDIPPAKFLPYIEEAIQLVRNKFPIPVPFMQNHSPAARLFVRWANTFPEHHQALSNGWMTVGPVADYLLHHPHKFWQERIGGPISPLLEDVLAGKIGNPPGWEGV